MERYYHSIDIGSLGITTEVGMPEIPHIAKILAIPDQGTVSVEVIEVSKSQIIKGINVPPARESWSEGKPETPYLENDLVYGSENLYPNELVKVEDPVIFRDFRIARVSIFPIRYSPGKKAIEVFSSVTVKIKYGGGLGINPKLSLKKPIAPSFDRIYKSCIFNYNEVSTAGVQW
ncbi:MAG: C25 family peptidase propeptide domain-containing protein [Ignavibacteriaceae bacterium]|nr:C25 family peptidase propeptide domain-containing protein [Ignavibacteriaceae bacterium]